MIVVDTNILCYFLIPNGFTTLVDRVWRADPAWHAPLLWRSEFLNVLAGNLHTRRIDLSTALQIFGRAEALMRGQESPVSADDVLRLAAGSGCTAYDCEFVSLAERLGVPLVTTDRQVLRAFPGIARSPERFLAERRAPYA